MTMKTNLNPAILAVAALSFLPSLAFAQDSDPAPVLPDNVLMEENGCARVVIVRPLERSTVERRLEATLAAKKAIDDFDTSPRQKLEGKCVIDRGELGVWVIYWAVPAGCQPDEETLRQIKGRGARRYESAMLGRWTMWSLEDGLMAPGNSIVVDQQLAETLVDVLTLASQSIGPNVGVGASVDVEYNDAEGLFVTASD